MTPSERPTKPDLEAEDSPTLRAWEVEAIQDLEKQLDRLRSGRACRTCLGAGSEVRGGPNALYTRACGDCGGKGIS